MEGGDGGHGDGEVDGDDGDGGNGYGRSHFLSTHSPLFANSPSLCNWRKKAVIIDQDS